MTRVITHMANEQDLRLQLLNTLLTTPHRKLEEVRAVHGQMVASDPRFYVRLAAWYFDKGEVRDHKEMFVISLVLSDFAGHRDVGLAMLRQFPPYEVLRVLDFIHGRKTTRKVVERAPKVRKTKSRKTPEAAAVEASAPEVKPGLIDRIARFVTGASPEAAAKVDTAPGEELDATPPLPVKLVTESFGLFRNPPRSLKTEIVRYLREREADADWFDGSVLVARKAIKRLYALNHVKPGERAQRILFDENPPQDSRIYALRQLAKAETPSDQARAIVDNAIPYRVASTVIKQMTPTVLLALIERMSAAELINNVSSLTKRGAMENADLKALIEQKLEQARTAPRVSALKAQKAIESAGASVSAEVKAQLESVADTQIKAKGRIDRPTALLIDKSGSMALAIELGKRIGAMISAVCRQDLFVYAFDTMAYPILRPFDHAQGRGGDDLASWEKALLGITAGGGTSCGVALETMRLKGQYVEQIILVTDEGENTAPLFVPTLQKYRETVKADSSICIVRVPSHVTTLETQCRAAGMAVDVFQFAGDYYSLPNLIPLLSKPSKLELLMEILDYPLPQRKSA
jgi:hypothetical protein